MKKLAIILTAIISITTNTNVMAQHKITQTAGRTVLGDFAPKFAEINDDVLFGEAVWNDTTLSLHDHSMVTISILLGKGLIDSSFRSHLEMGKAWYYTERNCSFTYTSSFLCRMAQRMGRFSCGKRGLGRSDRRDNRKRSLSAGNDIPYRRT